MAHECSPTAAISSDGEAVVADIRSHGWHFHQVDGGPLPAWSYSIGLQETFGAPELVLAGAVFFSRHEIRDAFSDIVERLAGERPAPGETWEVEGLGLIRFATVHPTWRAHLLAGATDHYGARGFEVLQITPAGEALTMDVPDAGASYDPASEVPWRWLVEDWPYGISPRTLVLTDLDALRTRPVLTISRHAPDSPGSPWDAFASPLDPMPGGTLRAAPLGTLIALDPSLRVMEDLVPYQTATRADAGSGWVKADHLI